MTGETENTIAVRIRRAREALGISKAELARRLTRGQKTLSREAVSQWESGKTTPETDRIGEIAAVLGVDPGEILGGTAIVGELVEHDAASGAVRLRWYRPETTHKIEGARVVRIIRAIEWSELIAVA